MISGITIEATGSKETEVCDCCGRSSRCVWGLANTNDRCLAAYFVHWTLRHVADRGANIDLIVGEWGDAATPERRTALALAYRLLDAGPSMMLIDASTRPVSRSSLAARALSREEAIGTSLAQHAFAIADAILAQDERVSELLGGCKITA
jgi:hypothetical protein